jgi:hypothetical protein
MDPGATSLPRPRGRPRAKDSAPLDHATRLILEVCRLVGPTAILDDTGEPDEVTSAIRDRDTAVLFDWLMAALSYQGISDQVAADYIERHGLATWPLIERDLHRRPSCPKLASYWHFHDCHYNKTRYTCAEPDHLPDCPLPNHWLRNGRLNQSAYSLYLFVRDVTGSDLVGWIDRRLNAGAKQPGPNRLARMRAALVEPMKEVYGVSDKVLMMALSQLFLGAPRTRRRWREVGGSMIAVDTLVHNFLHRTGILRLACYRPGGCAEIIETVAGQIDARQFDRRFPRTFLRFVQHAIWRYCAQNGLDICNGNKIDDRKRCTNKDCSLYSNCDLITLRKGHKSSILYVI